MLDRSAEEKVSSENVLQAERIEVLMTDDKRVKAVCAALANDTCRDIINLLYEQPYSVSEISNKLEISPPLVTHHVSHLLDIGLLTMSKEDSKMQRNRQVSVYSPTKLGIFLIPKSVVKGNSEALTRLKRAFLDSLLDKALTSLSFIGITATTYMLLGELVPIKSYSLEPGQSPILIIAASNFLPLVLVASTAGTVLTLLLRRLFRRNNSGTD